MTDINALLRELEEPSFAEANDAEHLLGKLEKLEQEGTLLPSEVGELARLREQSPANQQAIGETGALYRGALQGGTFNFADELAPLFGGNTDEARLKNLEAEAAFPDDFQKGRLTGGAATGLGLGAAAAPFATGATIWGTMARGAGLGGLEGALWGAGQGEGLEDKAVQAGVSGAIGAGVGAAAPPLVAGGAAVARGADNVVRGGLNLGNKARANRTIMDTLRKAGVSVDDAAGSVSTAAQQGQPEFRLMDAMGVAGQRRASGITRAGDDGAEEIAQFLRQRQADQSDRVLGFTDDAFGTTGTTASKTRESLTNERGRVANEAYAEARGNAAPVDVRGALSAIDDRIGGMQGSNVTGDGIDAKLSRFRSRLAADPAPDGEISRELSDFDRVLGVKQDIQDSIGAAVRAGRNNEVRELTKIVRELDAALEQSSDAYRFANDGFREASKVIDSVDTGAQMATRGRPEDTIPQFQAMTPQQQRAARVGYGDTISESIQRNKAQAPNAAREFNSTKRQAESEAMALDPSLLNSRIARENTMNETFQRALGGSRTADNLEDIADTGIVADAARATRDVAAGNPGNALAGIGGALAQKATGQNEATRQMIARLLLSNDPKAALSEALRQQGQSNSRKRVADALMRALGRENNPLN